MGAFKLGLIVSSLVALETSCGSESIGKIFPTQSGGAGGSGGNGTAGAGGQSPTDGGGVGDAITKVVPTAGCGNAPPPGGRSTIMTMGTKPTGCADSNCGAWSYEREYFLNLPANYNNAKAYPLVFQGPSCASTGQTVYPLDDGMGGPGNVGDTVIRVGLTPPPNTIGHATNPNQGCFDDREGDDSVEWVFYENLWDRLAAQLCFDKNRVFASGSSSGGSLANQLGCKYAGDPVHPIRATMSNGGGLPDQPSALPTCTTKPAAGFWVYPLGNTTDPPNLNQFAISRAMKANGCPGGGYSGATWDPFAIGGGNADDTCRKMRGCPEIDPLVECVLPGTAAGSHDSVANPGFSTFVKMFSAGAFITP